MDKQHAIRAVNEHLGSASLTPENTRWSRRHAQQKCWWLNIEPHMFDHDLHLCLGLPDGFVWLHIPPNGFRAEDFQVKSPTDARRNIELRCDEDEADYLTDRRSGIQFAPYIEHRFAL